MSAKIAFIFPGQGSQELGMLSDFASAYQQVRQTFAEASEALGYDLFSVIQVDEDRLNQTEYTQPAILTASIAIWRVWQDLNGIQPHFLAGHSLGEYTALVAAGVLSLPAAVKLVALRGRLMQQAVPEGQGAMAAILGLSDDQVAQVCEAARETQVLSVANFNCPGQVVISGHAQAIERALLQAKSFGAKRALKLPVSVPSHCELMQSAAQALAAEFANLTWKAPQYPIVHNVDVCTHSDISDIQTALVGQLSASVRWVETVEYLHAQGATVFIECGPGKVLTGLNKRIVKETPVLSLDTVSAMGQAFNFFQESTSGEA